MKTNVIFIFFIFILAIFMCNTTSGWAQQAPQRSLKLVKIENTYKNQADKNETKLCSKLQKIASQQTDPPSVLDTSLIKNLDIKDNSIHLVLRCNALEESNLEKEIRTLQAKEILQYEGMLTAWIPLQKLKELTQCQYLVKAMPQIKPEVLVNKDKSNVVATTIESNGTIKKSLLPETKNTLVSSSK